jgi:hypothetical protein
LGWDIFDDCFKVVSIGSLRQGKNRMRKSEHSGMYTAARFLKYNGQYHMIEK